MSGITPEERRDFFAGFERDGEESVRLELGSRANLLGAAWVAAATEWLRQKDEERSSSRHKQVRCIGILSVVSALAATVFAGLTYFRAPQLAGQIHSPVPSSPPASAMTSSSSPLQKSLAPAEISKPRE